MELSALPVGWPPSTPQMIPGLHLCKRRLEGLSHSKKPVIPWDIEPATSHETGSRALR
jgi:hypothetical protein